MGVVYKARDPRLKRFVAIKMMLAGDHADQDDFARFQLEAEAVARLQHPNIVQIFEVGEHDEHPYIALEFVDGPDLSTYVQGEPQPQRLAAELVLMLAQAMQYAHSHGIVHRDLKPANILLEGVEESSDSSVATDESTATDQPSSSGGSTVVDQVETMASTKSATRSARSRSSDSSLIQPSGERTTASGILAKITDFGLAKQLDAQSHLTATGAVVGTPQFMAPEQSAGETHAIGTAADVYSLGAILDFVITGRAPFYGASIVETLMMVRNDDPAAPTLLVPHLSKDLETICLTCLEKSPDRRYASAGDLAAELQRFLGGEPILARPVGHIERAWRWRQRNPMVAGLMMACVVLFVAGFSGVTWKWREASTNFTAATIAEGKAKISEATAQAERNAAVAARLAQQRQSSRILFNRGVALCREANVDVGIHWLIESLRVAPVETEDEDWRQVIRLNLNAWASHIDRLQYQLDFPQSICYTTISPDGKMLVVGSMQGVIRRFDLKTGRLLGKPASLDIPLTGWSATWSLAFHPDGAWFLAGGGEQATDRETDTAGIVQRYNAQTGEEMGKPVHFPQCVDQVAISPRGDLYAVGYDHKKRDDGFVSVRRVADDQPLFESVPISGPFYEIAFSLKGRFLLVRTAGRKAGDKFSVINTRNGQLVSQSLSEQTDLNHHGSEVTSLQLDGIGPPVRFSRRRANAVDHQRRFQISNFDTKPTVRKLARPQSRVQRPDPTARFKYDWHNVVAVSPQHDSILVGFQDGTAHLLDTDSGCLRYRPLRHSLAPEPRRVLAVAFSQDGSLCATATTYVQVWDVATGQPIGKPLPHTNTISVIAFSPDKKTLAVGDYSWLVKLWDVETGALLEPVLEQRDIVTCLDFSPDGKLLAVGTASDWNHDPQAQLWNLTTHKLVGLPIKFGAYVRQVDFSANGTRLLTVSSDATARIWNTKTVEQVGDTIPFTQHLSYAIFSPDSSLVLTGNPNGDVRGWNSETGEAVPGAVVHGPAPVTTLAFSRDGSRFVAAYSDGTSQLIDARQFLALGPPTIQRASIKRIAVSNDGSSWMTVLEDGTARTWLAPRPIAGSATELALRFQVATGSAIDTNQSSTELTLEQWRQRKHQLEKLTHRNSESLDSTYGDLNEVSWHEARLRDAEEDRNWFTVSWHIDWLIEMAPNNWQYFAQRGRAHSQRLDFAAATTAYNKASQLLEKADQPSKLALWYRKRAANSGHATEWKTAAWYLDRLLVQDPTDVDLLARRKKVAAKLDAANDAE